MSEKNLRIEYSQVKTLFIGHFDNDKELELHVQDIPTDKEYCVYLTSNYINDIVCHLVEQLHKVGEPVKVLEDYKSRILEAVNK